jgi:hypothetical protein
MSVPWFAVPCAPRDTVVPVGPVVPTDAPVTMPCGWFVPVPVIRCGPYAYASDVAAPFAR